MSRCPASEPLYARRRGTWRSSMTPRLARADCDRRNSPSSPRSICARRRRRAWPSWLARCSLPAAGLAFRRAIHALRHFRSWRLATNRWRERNWGCGARARGFPGPWSVPAQMAISLTDYRMAFACDLLKPATVDNSDPAACLSDEPHALQRPCNQRHAGPASPPRRPLQGTEAGGHS